MLFLNAQGLGEQALNKIAELALQSQFEKAERLTVRIKTDPNLLAQGRLESLSIEGRGLVKRDKLQFQGMQIEMEGIAVSPFKALTGNIQLTEPSQGTASFVLTDIDFSRALCNKLPKEQFRPASQSVSLNSGALSCRFLAGGKIAIATEVWKRETQQTHPILLTAKPKLDERNGGVALEAIQGTGISSQQTQVWMQKVTDILNLRDFAIPGLSLKIHHFKLEEGKITLQARAKMTQFPT